MDNFYADRYHVIYPDFHVYSWLMGWQIFDKRGTPPVDMISETKILSNQINYSDPLKLSDLWPDTKDYDQNNPGIMERAQDLDRRAYKSDIEKAFWLNVLRVPICASYLAACAKIRPFTILELGTGGDSAHSTGIFLYWLDNPDNRDNELNMRLVSVDRHPLSHVWLRYRQYDFWHFIQGDSITVMKALNRGDIKELPAIYDLIFIDSSHTYPHTLRELEQATCMTNSILLDDTTVKDVKKSLDEFLIENKDWLKIDLAHGVTLIEKHSYL